MRTSDYYSQMPYCVHCGSQVQPSDKFCEGCGKAVVLPDRSSYRRAEQKGVGAGVAVGWVRGRAHEVYVKDGSIFAQRTVLYLGVWAAAYGTTQLLALAAANIWLVRGGLVSGAFTTAMLAVVSLVLLMERNRRRAG